MCVRQDGRSLRCPGSTQIRQSKGSVVCLKVSSVVPIEQQLAQPDPTRTNSTVNDDKIGDIQLLNLPADKCDLLLSSNCAIIKQKNFSSEGVHGRLQPCLRFLACNTPMPTVCV